MPQAQIAASHFEAFESGEGQKICRNYYVEKNPTDNMRPIKLVQRSGSLDLDTGGTISTGVRGLFQADGFASGQIIIPDGAALRKYSTSGGTFSTISGAIPSTGFAQAAFSEVQGGFLFNGSFYVSDGGSVAAASDADWATLLSDHGETGFTSLATVGQRAVLTYGSRFAFSTTLEFNTTTTLSYYTAESSPDGIVCGAVLGDMVYIFGTQTIEQWVQTGNNDNPFARLPAPVIQRGCVGRDTVVEIDNTLMFIADDYTVRRLDGQVPTIMNKDDPWVTQVLRDEGAANIKCGKIEIDAHTFYTIWTPNKFIVLDLAYGTFQIWDTYLSDTWRYGYFVQAGSNYYAGDADGTGFAQLSRDHMSDHRASASTLGTQIVREFTAHLPTKSGRPPMGHIRLEGTKGIGLASGQGSSPVAALAISKNKGASFGSERQRSLGTSGNYAERTVWHQNGRAAPEMTVLKFRVSDPVSFSPHAVMVNEGG